MAHSGSAVDARRPAASHSGLRISELAFFLDVDGTLLEIAPTPDEVSADPLLVKLLRSLAVRAGGAVAFISGRSILALDRIFQPLMLPAAGLHGFERRDARGAYLRRPLPPGVPLFKARVALQNLVDANPGLLLEDKRFALALHYRLVPHLEPELLEKVTSLVATLGADFHLQRGRCVFEIRPASANKGLAIAEFMGESPFNGRRPVCLGDDLTDECAFEWVNAAGGLSVAVGVDRESAAQAHLHSVSAARLWLRRLIEQGE